MVDWLGQGIGKVVKYSTAPISAIVALAAICAILIGLVTLSEFNQRILVLTILVIVLVFSGLLIFKRDALSPKKEDRLLWHAEQLGDNKSSFLYMIGEDLRGKIPPLVEDGREKS